MTLHGNVQEHFVYSFWSVTIKCAQVSEVCVMHSLITTKVMSTSIFFSLSPKTDFGDRGFSWYTQ